MKSSRLLPPAQVAGLSGNSSSPHLLSVARQSACPCLAPQQSSDWTPEAMASHQPASQQIFESAHVVAMNCRRGLLPTRDNGHAVAGPVRLMVRLPHSRTASETETAHSKSFLLLHTARSLYRPACGSSRGLLIFDCGGECRVTTRRGLGAAREGLRGKSAARPDQIHWRLGPLSTFPPSGHGTGREDQVLEEPQAYR